MKKRPNRVLIFFAALICTGMGGYLLTWSYFRDALGQLFPVWSQSRLSLPFSLHNVTVCIMMLLTGQIMRKLSARVVLSMGGLSLLIGFGLFPALPLDNPDAALVMITVCFGVIAAVSAAIGVIAGFDTFLPWFPERPGMVTGILTLFCGGAPMILGALCGALTESFGVLRAIQLLGIMLAVLIALSLFWAKRPAPDAVLPAPRSKKTGAVPERDYPPKEMLSTGTFWCVFMYNVLIRSAGLIIFDLGGSIAVAIGLTAIIGLIFAPMNGLACILGGFILDKVSSHKVMLLFGICAALGGAFLISGNSVDSSFMIILGIGCTGFGYGGAALTSVSAPRALFGTKYYAQNLGFVYISIGPAAIACFLAGKLSAGNSFAGVFSLVFILGAASVLSCCIMFITERSRKKREAGHGKDAPA